MKKIVIVSPFRRLQGDISQVVWVVSGRYFANQNSAAIFGVFYYY